METVRLTQRRSSVTDALPKKRSVRQNGTNAAHLRKGKRAGSKPSFLFAFFAVCAEAKSAAMVQFFIKNAPRVLHKLAHLW